MGAFFSHKCFCGSCQNIQLCLLQHFLSRFTGKLESTDTASPSKTMRSRHKSSGQVLNRPYKQKPMVKQHSEEGGEACTAENGGWYEILIRRPSGNVLWTMRSHQFIFDSCKTADTTREFPTNAFDEEPVPRGQ